MRFAKALDMALNILLHSKLRSWLTIIGIVIGVGAIVAIVSIGEGMQQNIQSRLMSLGADIITITPGGSQAFRGFMRGGSPGSQSGGTSSDDAKNLTKKDIQNLQSIDNIEFIEGIVSGRGEVYYLGEKATVSISGVDPLVWNEVTTAELESGRFLGPSDYNTVIVGNRIANDVFKQPLMINRMITIEGTAFKVVGVLKEGDEENAIIMPIKAARITLDDVGTDEFDSIVIKAADVDAVDQILEDIDEKLRITRHVTERTKDYQITSAKAMQESISEIAETMTLFLGGIAAVSLVVGAVGVANTQFTSVLEKTKDIGIMKAIGAKNRDIMLIFIFNSGLVGFVGGLLGIGLGTAASSMLSLIGVRLMGAGMGGEMTTVVTPQLLIFSLFFSVIIGVLAGVVPAYNASKLKPVDALRAE